MKQVILTRTSDDGVQSLGMLTCDDFECATLELPYKDNQHSISCIPHGIYRCMLTRSNRLSTLLGHDVTTYEVFDVPNRSGIRIHSANFSYQLLGCIALGSNYADIDGNGKKDLINSRLTVNKFHEFMDGADFELVIKENFDSIKVSNLKTTI